MKVLNISTGSFQNSGFVIEDCEVINILTGSFQRSGFVAEGGEVINMSVHSFQISGFVLEGLTDYKPCVVLIHVLLLLFRRVHT